MVQALRLNSKDDRPVHAYYCGPALGIPETIQDSMAQALAKDEDVGMEEEQARAFMDRLVRHEDRFHTECF